MIFPIRSLIFPAVLSVAQEWADSPRPNMLLIVSEDNGPELGCYGTPHVRTPVLDRLAAEGVRFGTAFVPFSVCNPSRAALLTGLHPHQNGQLGLPTQTRLKRMIFPSLDPNALWSCEAASSNPTTALRLSRLDGTTPAPLARRIEVALRLARDFLLRRAPQLEMIRTGESGCPKPRFLALSSHIAHP